MNSIVITGPTGTIGIALIKKMISEKIYVLAIVREGSQNINLIPKSIYVEVIECNLNNLKILNISKQYDVFFHFAWDGTIGIGRDDLYHQLDNVIYTLDAVHLANKLGCSLFIGAGSQAEFGRSNTILSPKSLTNPETGYGIAKLTAGHMSRSLCKTLNIRNLWVRVFSIYGPNDDKNTLIMSLINNISTNTSIRLTAGEQIWDYLYSADAAQAFYLLAKSKDLNNKIYCLGGGIGKPLKDYIKDVRDIINPKYDLVFGENPYSQNQVMHLIADISDLKLDVGFEPITLFNEGIKNIILGEKL